MDEDVKNAASTVNQYFAGQKMSAHEKILAVGFAATALVAIYKIRVQNKQLTQMLDLAGTAMSHLNKAQQLQK